MNTMPVSDVITLTGILPDVRRLPLSDKLRLIRILAEELENSDNIFLFEQGKTYSLPTPYNTFGAGEILMNALKTSGTGQLFAADTEANNVRIVTAYRPNPKDWVSNMKIRRQT